ncbi:myb domain-containing protein, putative [Babesia caballi]|uniref:Myb domain-containing protein, putative n=1 Tax=Babesia caballi TaxID=5871 RepID=A0AAV4M3A6_BABCB|nr:myb domain-containing protein, putative [Babesia caballi]
MCVYLEFLRNSKCNQHLTAPQGPFSKEEEEKLRKAIDDHIGDLRGAERNAAVRFLLAPRGREPSRVVTLGVSVLPDRHPKSIYNFTRRRILEHDTGRWTPSEVYVLLNHYFNNQKAHDERPDNKRSWRAVAQQINRLPEQIYDKWKDMRPTIEAYRPIFENPELTREERLQRIAQTLDGRSEVLALQAEGGASDAGSPSQPSQSDVDGASVFKRQLDDDTRKRVHKFIASLVKNGTIQAPVVQNIPWTKVRDRFPLFSESRLRLAARGGLQQARGRALRRVPGSEAAGAAGQAEPRGLQRVAPAAAAAVRHVVRPRPPEEVRQAPAAGRAAAHGGGSSALAPGVLALEDRPDGGGTPTTECPIPYIAGNPWVEVPGGYVHLSLKRLLKLAYCEAKVEEHFAEDMSILRLVVAGELAREAASQVGERNPALFALAPAKVDDVDAVAQEGVLLVLGHELRVVGGLPLEPLRLVPPERAVGGADDVEVVGRREDVAGVVRGGLEVGDDVAHLSQHLVVVALVGQQRLEQDLGAEGRGVGRRGLGGLRGHRVVVEGELHAAQRDDVGAAVGGATGEQAGDVSALCGAAVHVGRGLVRLQLVLGLLEHEAAHRAVGAAGDEGHAGGSG